MEHVICGACNSGIVQTALVDEFEDVVHAGEDVVHENYGIEILVLGTSQLMEGNKCSIANFSEVLDTVVERTTCALGCADGDAKSDGAGDCVENAENGLCLIRGAVLVDGYKDVVVTEDSRDAEERREEVWDDIERIVEVDGKKVMVLFAGKVAPMVVEGGLFLTRARERVETAETEVKEPGFGRRWVVTDEGCVSFASLVHVQRIEVSRALASVMRRHGAEEVQDAPALLERRRPRLARRRRLCVGAYWRVSAPAPCCRVGGKNGGRDEACEEDADD